MMRSAISFGPVVILVACTAQQPVDPPTTTSAATPQVTAPAQSPFPNGRSGNLPTNLWTTRLGGSRIEATVSNGTSNLGIACVANRQVALRFRPGGTLPADDTTVTLASEGVRIGLPMRPDGAGNLRATLPVESLLSPILAAVADGAALNVQVESPLSSTVFQALGASGALSTALNPGGCTA